MCDFIHVTVEHGKDLAAKDSNGLSDPYCKVWIESNEEPLSKAYITAVETKTLNPVWQEKISLPLLGEELVIQCWDKDRVSDDFMGEIRFLLSELRDDVFEGFKELSPRKKKKQRKKDLIVSGELFLHIQLEIGGLMVTPKHVIIFKQAKTLYDSTDPLETALAYKKFREAWELGSIDAITMLAEIYIKGEYYESTEAERFACYREALGKRCLSKEITRLVAYQVGMYYIHGIVCERSEENAIEFFRIAAAHNYRNPGYPPAQYEYASLLLKKDEKILCEQFYEYAAQQDHLKSCLRLARMYKGKDHCLQYINMALRIDPKCGEAYHIKATCFELCENVNSEFIQDEKQFSADLERAHQLNYTPSTHKLACYYIGGFSPFFTAVDPKRGLDLLHIASERKYLESIQVLAGCYAKGKNVKKDLERANDLYNQATLVLGDPDDLS